MFENKEMVKIAFMSLACAFVVGCSTPPIYPNIVHTLPAESQSLPIQVNIDCISTFKLSERSEERTQRCEQKYNDQLIQSIKARKLFSEVVTGENRYLEKHQVTVRVDVRAISQLKSKAPQANRSNMIRWTAWNSDGLLFTKEETFAYFDKDSAGMDRILDWHMKMAEDAYVELRKKF